MGRRSAFVAAAAYVAYGVVSSYALLALVDPYEGGERWLVVYLALGAALSIAVGAAISRWWALLLPPSLAVAAVPAPDVLEQLPLWALVVVCAPFAVAGIAFGWAARRLASQPSWLDAI